MNQGRVEDRKEVEEETRRLSTRISTLNSDDARALSEVGHALAYICRELERGATFIDRALLINPNLARGWGLRGWVSAFLGEHEAAHRHFEQALRLSPVEPGIADWERGKAATLIFMGDYRAAAEWANRALAHQPDRMTNMRAADLWCVSSDYQETGYKHPPLTTQDWQPKGLARGPLTATSS